MIQKSCPHSHHYEFFSVCSEREQKSLAQYTSLSALASLPGCRHDEPDSLLKQQILQNVLPLVTLTVLGFSGIFLAYKCR